MTPLGMRWVVWKRRLLRIVAVCCALYLFVGALALGVLSAIAGQLDFSFALFLASGAVCAYKLTGWGIRSYSKNDGY